MTQAGGLGWHGAATLWRKTELYELDGSVTELDATSGMFRKYTAPGGNGWRMEEVPPGLLKIVPFGAPDRIPILFSFVVPAPNGARFDSPGRSAAISPGYDSTINPKSPNGARASRNRL